MKEPLASRAGTALGWRAAELAGTKAIQLGRIVVLAWLLSPDDFGLFAVSVIAVDFLLSVTDTGMVPALVQRGETRRGAYDAAWSVGVARALAVAAIVFLGAPAIAGLFDQPRAVGLLRALAFRPLLEAGASIRLASLTRDLEFRALSGVRLAAVAVNAVVSIAAARPFGVWALVAGPLAGSLTYLIASYAAAPYRPRLSMTRGAMGPLIDFGRWIWLTGVLAVAASTVLQLVISRRLGAADLGLYFLAARLAFLPAEIASEVVGAVAFPVYSRLKEHAVQGARAFRSIFTGTAVLVLPASLLLVVLAPALVEHVLGPRWAGTTSLIQVLALVNVVGMLGDAAIPALKGAGRPRQVAVLEAVQGVSLVILVWLLADPFGVVGAAAAWLPAVAASQVAAAWFLRGVVARPFAGLGRPMIAVGFAAALGAGAAWPVVRGIPGPFGLALALLLSGLVIVAVLWALERGWELGLARDLKRSFPRLASLLPADRTRG